MEHADGREVLAFPGTYTSLYNTNLESWAEDGGDDGEAWIKRSGSDYFGFSGHGYVETLFPIGEYFRIVLTFDLEAATAGYYMNGRLLQKISMPGD